MKAQMLHKTDYEYNDVCVVVYGVSYHHEGKLHVFYVSMEQDTSERERYKEGCINNMMDTWKATVDHVYAEEGELLGRWLGYFPRKGTKAPAPYIVCNVVKKRIGLK